MFYISFIYLLLLYLLRKNIPNRYKVILSLIPFIIISFIRFGIGADYFAYQNIYYSTDPSNINASFQLFKDIEPMYMLINLLSRSFGIPYSIFAGLVSSAIAIVTVIWIKEVSGEYELSVLLYYVMFFLVFGLSALRQGIAMAILMYVFFNKDDKFSILQKVLMSIAMFFIHSSSIIVLFIYFISSLKWTKKSLLIVLLIALTFNVIPVGKYLSFLERIPYLAKVLYYVNENSIKAIISFPSTIRIFFFFLLWCHYDRLKETSKNEYRLLKFTMLSLVIYFFTLFSGLLASRISVYGYFLMIVLLPSIMLLHEKKELKTIATVSIIVFSFVSLAKELTTLTYQTEYTLSTYMLNFETVFSKNYDHFSKGYSLVEMIREQESEKTDIENKVYSSSHTLENTINEDDIYLSVYFPNENLYGVINQRGEVVELPTSDIRNNIYKDKIEITYNPYEYQTRLYRTIGTNDVVEYNELLQISQNIALEKANMNRYWFTKVVVAMENLPESFSFEKYDKQYFHGSILYNSPYYPEFNYIKLLGPIFNYNFILNEDYSIKLEKPYQKIVPYNEKRIAIGYTEYSRDYINEFGEIIWTEKLNISE